MSEILPDQKVKELIPVEDEREKLFDALRQYQLSHNLLQLLTNLRGVLNQPSKLELYEFLRPLILLKHQIPYSRYAPPSPGTRQHVVRLQRRPGESLGFAVRGGYEHGLGIFVTDVAPGSQAERQGLRIGDEIVRVNGFTISEAVHDDVLRLIKSREDDITLKVIHIGMIPVREEAAESVSWKYVDQFNNFSEEVKASATDIQSSRLRDIKILIDSTGHASIGCTLRSESGPSARYPGIFIDKVKQGSLAEEVGLQPGDQILEVNHVSFRGITWDEALLALKSSRQLNFVIRQNRLPPQALLTREEAKVEPPVVKKLDPEPIQPRVEELPPPPQPPSQPEEIPVITKRSKNFSGPEEMVNEDQIIQHQLAMQNWRLGSASTSVISTPVEVHQQQTDPFTTDKPSWHRHSLISQSDDSHTFPMGGAAARKSVQQQHEDSGKSSNYPRLLELEGEFGWTDRLPARMYQKFSPGLLEGRPLKCLTFRKTSDLGIAVEGGRGSPLGDGKLLVSLVFDDGVAYRSGKIKVGDQILMINGRQLLGLTASEAEQILQDAHKSSKDTEVELIYCESTLINDEDSVTYF